MKQKILFLFALLCMICMGAKADVITSQEDFASALSSMSDGATITLGAGSFTLDDGTMTIASVSSFTIEGSGTSTVLAVGNSKGDGNGGVGCCIGAAMTFENLELASISATTYTGFTQAAALTFTNVTFNCGFSNWGNKGGDVKFYNCTFKQTSTSLYCVQELRSDDGTSFLFDGCTFESAGGRFINAYMQGGSTVSISVEIKNCTFTNTGSSSKAALNLKDSSNGCTIALTFVGTNTFEGAFPTNPSAAFQTEGAGNATVYVKDTDDSKAVTIYTNNAKTDDWVDPNGNAPAAEVKTVVAKIGDTEYTDLQTALEAATAALTSPTATVTVDIVADITYDATATWTSVAYTYGYLTINGNNHTITNLPGMLLDKQGSGGHFLTVKNLTFESPKAVNTSSNYVAVIVGYADCMNLAYFENVHINNATVESGKYAGAFIGYAAGYNNTGDGPVYQEITFKNCSVTNSTIKGAGSVGGLIGHAAGNTWASVVVDGTTVTGNTITSTATDDVKAGSLFGTIGAAGITADLPNAGIYVNATVSGNTVTYGGTKVTTIYGRQGTSTGTLRLTAGGSYDAAPIAETDAAWASCVEGYELTQKADGTYTTTKANNFYQDADDANLWHIANLAGLQEFATAVKGGETYSGKTIQLDADIDLNNAAWTPISTSSDKGFKGTFEGNNKTISNFTITGTAEHVSFFGPSYAPTIQNLTFDNATVSGGDNAGIVVGYCATVKNVTVQNSKLTGAERVGAIAGGGYTTVDGCTVKNCTITGTEQVAAIEGYVCVSNITNCKSIDNTIIATSQRAGGIAGKLEVSGDNKGYMYCNGNTVTNTTIITPASAGALAGQMYGAGTNIEKFQICNNTVDATFYSYDADATDKKGDATTGCPIAPLRGSSYTDFNSLIESNITGNSWTTATYSDCSYTYTAAETGATAQTIYNMGCVSGTVYAGSATPQEGKSMAEFNTIRETYPNAIMIVGSASASAVKEGTTNVIIKYEVGATYSYQCPNFVLTDKKDFYTPVDFIALAGSYSRVPNAVKDANIKYNSVCLPFDLKATDLSSTAKILTFAYYDGEATVYFNQVSNVDAGTPCIVYEEATSWNTISFANTEISGTPDNDGNMKGTFALTAQYGKEANGGTTEYYSVNTEGKFQTLSNTLTAFRSCLYLHNDGAIGTEDESAAAAPRLRIIEETTDLDSNEAEVVIGKAGVYTITGQFIGEDAENLAPGFYIIKGVKAIVK